MADRYTKVVLTVIAAALVWLCLWGTGPLLLGTPAEAQYGSSTVDVNIAAVAGKKLTGLDKGVPVTGQALQVYPIEVKAVR